MANLKSKTREELTAVVGTVSAGGFLFMICRRGGELENLKI